MASLLRPPGLPTVIEGFLNLAGRGVAVVRLDRLFGLPENRIDLSTALVVLRGEPPLALLVDEVVNVRDVAADQRVALPPGNTLNDCATGAWDDGHGLIHILATERILLEEERHRIADLEARMQDRIVAIAEVTAS